MPPMKGDCLGDAGVKMGLKAPAKCEVSLTCLPAALFFGLVLTETVILWTLDNSKLDLNPSLGINLFLYPSRLSPGPDIECHIFKCSIYTYVLSTYCALGLRIQPYMTLPLFLRKGSIFFFIYT